ncbi:hypothetical protein BgiMline_023771 [Biomphalaria glabrata]
MGKNNKRKEDYHPTEDNSVKRDTDDALYYVHVQESRGPGIQYEPLQVRGQLGGVPVEGVLQGQHSQARDDPATVRTVIEGVHITQDGLYPERFGGVLKKGPQLYLESSGKFVS